MPEQFLAVANGHTIHPFIVCKAVNCMRAAAFGDMYFVVLRSIVRSFCVLLISLWPQLHSTFCTFYLILIESINKWMRSLLVSSGSRRRHRAIINNEFPTQFSHALAIINSIQQFLIFISYARALANRCWFIRGASKHKRKFHETFLWPCAVRRLNMACSRCDLCDHWRLLILFHRTAVPRNDNRIWLFGCVHTLCYGRSH